MGGVRGGAEVTRIHIKTSTSASPTRPRELWPRGSKRKGVCWLPRTRNLERGNVGVIVFSSHSCLLFNPINWFVTSFLVKFLNSLWPRGPWSGTMVLRCFSSDMGWADKLSAGFIMNFSPTGLESIWKTILSRTGLRETCVCSKSLLLCLTLCNPIDCGPPGSSVHGISQARILEWVAMPSSRGSSTPKDPFPHLLGLLHCRWILYRWVTRETLRATYFWKMSPDVFLSSQSARLSLLSLVRAGVQIPPTATTASLCNQGISYGAWKILTSAPAILSPYRWSTGRGSRWPEITSLPSPRQEICLQLAS